MSPLRMFARVSPISLVACLLAIFVSCTERDPFLSASQESDSVPVSIEETPIPDEPPTYPEISFFKIPSPDGQAGRSRNQCAIIVFNSKIYLAWSEANLGGSAGGSLRVAVGKGAGVPSAWSYVDSGGLRAGKGPGSARLAIFNSKLYGIWVEGGIVRAAVFNGKDDAPEWTLVDGSGQSLNWGENYTPSSASLVEHNGKLYATWQEGGARVAVFGGNDAAPVWSFVDGDTSLGLRLSSIRRADSPALGSIGSRLYIGWTESNGTATQLRLRMYNGSDPSPDWISLDGNGNYGLNIDPSASALSVFFATSASKLYAIWMERKSGATGDFIRAALVDDGSKFAWSSMDTSRLIAPPQAGYPSIVSLGSELIGSWIQYGSRNPFALFLAGFVEGSTSSAWGQRPVVPNVASTSTFSGTDFRLVVYGDYLIAAWIEYTGSANVLNLSAAHL